MSQNKTTFEYGSRRRRRLGIKGVEWKSDRKRRVVEREE